MTSEPDNAVEVGAQRGCGLSVVVAMGSSFILLVSAMWMWGGGEEGE